MMMYDDLIKRLRELHPEEFGDAWDFAFACQHAMYEAADAIEELRKAVLRLENESGIYDELPTFYIYPTEKNNGEI